MLLVARGVGTGPQGMGYFADLRRRTDYMHILFPPSWLIRTGNYSTCLFSGSPYCLSSTTTAFGTLLDSPLSPDSDSATSFCGAKAPNTRSQYSRETQGAWLCLLRYCRGSLLLLVQLRGAKNLQIHGQRSSLLLLWDNLQRNNKGRVRLTSNR